MKPIPYGKQQITKDDIAAVVEVLESDFLTQGPMVEKFEATIAKTVGSKYAVAVSNGTAALHLAALALEVKPGHKVICPTNSFVASSNCIEYCGAAVEFVDIDPDTFCIDVAAVQALLTSSKAGTYAGVVAVDFAGHPAELQELSQICKKHGLWLIEDACHSLGAKYQANNEWVACGSGLHADVAIFSFHPVKHVATGEGGVLTTNSKELYEKLKLLRTHGITKDPSQMTKVDGPWYYEMQQLGFNYRISDILCALGVSQMDRLESNLARRNRVAANYDSGLSGLPLELPVRPTSVAHAFHLYVIQTDRRKELYNFLREQGIIPQVHYIPIHTQPYYVEKYGEKSLPVAETYYSKALSLPMYHGITDEEQNFVIEKIKQFFSTR